jgi:hypothetical protein
VDLSPSRVKGEDHGSGIAASPLSMQHYGVRAKTHWNILITIFIILEIEGVIVV